MVLSVSQVVDGEEEKHDEGEEEEDPVRHSHTQQRRAEGQVTCRRLNLLQQREDVLVGEEQA